jgi:uncharacterized membrane protein YuzA (DUF378 family)
MQPDDLVELRKFPQMHDAELAVATLEAADIPALVRDSSYGGIRVETLANGITVLVRRDQRDAALQVLDSDVQARGDESGTSPCAGCGRMLPTASAVCPECNAEERETLLTPQRMKRAEGKLRVLVVGGTLALMILPVIISRLAEIDTDVWVTVAYVLAGIAGLFFILKVLTSGSDQRL